MAPTKTPQDDPTDLSRFLHTRRAAAVKASDAIAQNFTSNSVSSSHISTPVSKKQNASTIGKPRPAKTKPSAGTRFKAQLVMLDSSESEEATPAPKKRKVVAAKKPAPSKKTPDHKPRLKRPQNLPDSDDSEADSASPPAVNSNGGVNRSVRARRASRAKRSRGSSTFSSDSDNTLPKPKTRKISGNKKAIAAATSPAGRRRSRRVKAVSGSPEPKNASAATKPARSVPKMGNF
jgi:hypothetical protein